MDMETKKSKSCTPNSLPIGTPMGWVCPKCGAVLAPNQAFCPFCTPRPNTINITSPLVWGVNNSPSTIGPHPELRTTMTSTTKEI